MVQETGGANGNATDDYHIEYRVDGGGWVAVAAASLRVQAYPSSQLTDAGVTTNRAVDGLTDPGAGIFVQGEQEEGNGVIDDRFISANNFSEHVFAIILIALDNTHGELIEFRLIVTPGVIHQDVTPGITIHKRRLFGVI
jgi:hypothetical protein